jgi:dihydrolipoamide dehydrogenase
LIIVGGGPGGYAAALDAVSRGMRVTLVERERVGGTCTHRGCIPSKFFLSAAKRTADATHLAEDGINFRLESIQPELLFQKKDAVVTTLYQRMEKALKSSALDFIAGEARLLSGTKVEIKTDAGPVTREADAIVLATGTDPFIPKMFPSSPAIMTSTGILDLKYLPSHLVVLGGGYIGCELACAFHGFGCKVTLIEKETRLLGAQPEFEAASTILQRSFEKRGMTVWTRTEITDVKAIETNRLNITCSNGEQFEANALLLALGRRPNTEALNLQAAGIAVQNGRPQVNASMQTTTSSIYAIGDLVSPLPLAHVATREAQVAVAHIAGETNSINYSAIPRCVYTWPEAAAVGLTEQQAREAGFEPRVDRYHLAASSKAMVEQETEGLWMIISDAKTHKILGGQIVGQNATELIHLISLSLQAGLTAQDVLKSVFAHPSLAEGYPEALWRSLQNSKTMGAERK